MTNNYFGDMLGIKMFAAKFITGFKRDKKARRRGIDLVSEQVKKILQAQDQQLILMVRS